MDKSHENKDTGGGKLVSRIRANFQLASDAETNIRKLALEDLKFRTGDQWPGNVKAERERDQRPCLTINRLPQFTRQITNDQRQNRPQIRISPESGGATIKKAEILQGMARHIEQKSDADIAYDTAFRSAVDHGFGYFRFVTDYVDDKSFDQEIRFKRIRNPFKVYFDPTAQEACYEDAMWAMIVEDYTVDGYKAEFGDSELAQAQDWKSIGDQCDKWISEKMVRVAEYYEVKEVRVRKVLLSTGEIVDKKEIEYDGDIPILPPGLTITAERTVKERRVKWYKTNGYEILDSTDWLGRWIPIVPVLGDESEVDGERILEGVIRQAKDAQRMYNYWASAETEAIALSPRAPYIGAEGQFEGNEDQWKQANVRNYAYLQYKPKAFQGELVPPPQRNQYEPAVAAITNARLQAADDLKATTGIYDAALGNRSNERSGKAILARNNQTQTANYHYIDNLGRSVRHAGRILVDLIPKVYDGPRIAAIVDAEGKPGTVPINQQVVENGKPVTYDLSDGTYGVVIEAGPGYATKRQQAVSDMMELTAAYPQMAQIAGDLMVKNMDWPGAQEMADRLKKAIPPEFQDQPDGQQPMPPQIKQQLQEMDQMIGKLTEQLNAANDQLQSKQLENDSKEKIAFAQMRVDLVKTLITTKAKAESDEAKIAADKEARMADDTIAARDQHVKLAEDEIKRLNEELVAGQKGQPSPDDASAARANEAALDATLNRIGAGI